MSGVSAVSGKIVRIGGRCMSRETLPDQGARAATALDRIGVAEGDAIALLIRNDPCHFEIVQAAANLGADVVPPNWHSTADEIGYIRCPAARGERQDRQTQASRSLPSISRLRLSGRVINGDHAWT